MSKRIPGAFVILVAAAITACGGGGSGADGVNSGPDEYVVQVSLTEFGVEMDSSSVPAGAPVTFVFTNNGVLEHNIVLEPLDSVDEPLEYSDGELAKIVEIEPGDTATLTYVFQEGENFQVGTMVQLGCHLPGHYEAGMFQGFSIEP